MYFTKKQQQERALATVRRIQDLAKLLVQFDGKFDSWTAGFVYNLTSRVTTGCKDNLRALVLNASVLTERQVAKLDEIWAEHVLQSETVPCTFCGFDENPSQHFFCGACGSPLSQEE